MWLVLMSDMQLCSGRVEKFLWQIWRDIFVSSSSFLFSVVLQMSLEIDALFYRYTAEAINLLVLNKGQIEIGGEFLIEGKSSANVILLNIAFLW